MGSAGARPGMGGAGGMPAGIPPNMQNMLNNVNPAVLNSVMNGMGNMNLGGLLGNS